MFQLVSVELNKANLLRFAKKTGRMRGLNLGPKICKQTSLPFGYGATCEMNVYYVPHNQCQASVVIQKDLKFVTCKPIYCEQIRHFWTQIRLKEKSVMKCGVPKMLFVKKKEKKIIALGGVRNWDLLV